MVENVAIEISESEKNIKQIASIWGAVKRVCKGAILLLDICAPFIFMLMLTVLAMITYCRTAGSTRELTLHEFYMFKYSCLWTFICIPVQFFVIAFKKVYSSEN